MGEAVKRVVEEARRGLRALYLEAPKAVADDVSRRVESAFAAMSSAPPAPVAGPAVEEGHLWTASVYAPDEAEAIRMRDAVVANQAAPALPAELVELAEKATEGPWRVQGDEMRHVFADAGCVGTAGSYACKSGTDEERRPFIELAQRDARFIAEAVNYVRSLIASQAGGGAE
jgi:hypothetical protein